MDDLLALDGGNAATQWQKRHAKRKARETKLKARREMRAEAKVDLKKRTQKWLVKWKAEAAANKAAGLPLPSRHGRPRDIRRPQWIDMTGWRFGRLTVIRIAPVSKNGKQHCRRWWVKCDCGHAEHLVSGTCLRQGIARSCGCLKSEAVRTAAAKKRAERNRLRAEPLSRQIAELRHRIVSHSRVIRADAKLLTAVKAVLVEVEISQGVRKPRTRRSPALLQLLSAAA